MRKYWIVFTNSFQTSLAYRFNIFATFASEFFSLAVFSYLWMSIYSQGNKIGGYTLKGIIIYFLMTKFINLTIKSSDIAREIGDKIRNGEMSNYLVKPLGFFYDWFFGSLGKMIYRLIIYTLIVVAGFVLFDIKIHGYAEIIYFILSLIIAYIINFLVFYIVGISTFYFGFIQGFNFLMMGIVSFFSGSLIPLDLLPRYLIKITDFLPFKFITFFPISIVTGKVIGDELFLNYLISISWIIILFIFSKILYKKGLIKFEGDGL